NGFTNRHALSSVSPFDGSRIAWLRRAFTIVRTRLALSLDWRIRSGSSDLTTIEASRSNWRGGCVITTEGACLDARKNAQIAGSDVALDLKSEASASRISLNRSFIR